MDEPCERYPILILAAGERVRVPDQARREMTSLEALTEQSFEERSSPLPRLAQAATNGFGELCHILLRHPASTRPRCEPGSKLGWLRLRRAHPSRRLDPPLAIRLFGGEPKART